MKKRIVVCCLLIALCLTGCGKTDKIMQYVDYDNISLIDTEEEMRIARLSLKTGDSGQWSYRQENIAKVMELEKNIRAACKNDGTKVFVGDEEYNSASIETLENHRVQARDAKQEHVTQYHITVYAKDEKAMRKNCQALEKLGFDGLQEGVTENKEFYKGGLRLTTCNDQYDDIVEDEYGDLDYYEEPLAVYVDEDVHFAIDIYIPSMMLYGPERYFDLADSCFANNMFISEFICLGGAVDGMTVRSENAKLSTFLKDDKVLEIKALRVNKWEAGNFFSEKEQAGVAELLAHMNGDHNAAIRMVKEMTKEGKKRGNEGDISWNIRTQYKDDRISYLLEVQ